MYSSFLISSFHYHIKLYPAITFKIHTSVPSFLVLSCFSYECGLQNLNITHTHTHTREIMTKVGINLFAGSNTPLITCSPYSNGS